MRSTYSRRAYLVTLSTCAVVSAGCSTLEQAVSATNVEIGDEVSHRGLTVTVDYFTTADEIVIPQDIGNDITRTPPAGTSYLLTHLSVEHDSEHERAFPVRSHPFRQEVIRGFYRDEVLDTDPDLSRFPGLFEMIVVRGHELDRYNAQVVTGEYYLGTYAGSARGWLVDIIPEDFDPDETEMHIEWGGRDAPADDEHSKEYRWIYSEGGRVELAAVTSG